MLIEVDSRSLLAVALFFSEKEVELIEVDNGADMRVLLVVEEAHSDLAEVARVELVHENAVMMLATRVATAAAHTPCLPYASMPMRHVSTQLAALLQPGDHALI